MEYHLINSGGNGMGISILTPKTAINKNNKGSALIQDHRALQPFLGKDGFVIGHQTRLNLKKSFEHLALIGPTGSGKSSTFFIPNLLNLQEGVSAVVTDPKGELYWKTADDLRSRGFVPIRLAPFERSFPGYNILAVANGYYETKEIAQLILMNGALAFEVQGKSSGDSTWLNMSLPLLVAAFLYEKHMNPECPKIGSALSIILEMSLEDMRRHFSKVKAARREFNIFEQAAGSEKILASIRTTIATSMGLFMDEDVIDFAETNTIHPHHLRFGLDSDEAKRPVVLFISVDEMKSNYAAPLMAVIYQQLLQRVQDTANGRPVLFFLDEFANLGIIPIIDTVAATARSRDIGLAIGLQGVEQLRQKYGDAKADNLLNNLKTKIFLSGLSTVSCSYASEFCGTATVAQENLTMSWLSIIPKSKMLSYVERPAMTPDEVRRLDPAQMIVISDYLDAAIIKKIIYYEDFNLISRIRTSNPDLKSENEYNLMLKSMKN